MFCYALDLIYIDSGKRHIQHFISGLPPGGGYCPMLPPLQQVLYDHHQIFFPNVCWDALNDYIVPKIYVKNT